MADESTSYRSGGIDADKIDVGGDVVGRDKIVDESRHVHYHFDRDRAPALTGSRLPPRNPLFVGRGATLAQLAGRLSGDGALVVLTGAGGMGKTQTAIEFGHAHAAMFPGGVFWLRCNTPELISGEVAACGDKGRVALPNYDALPQPDKVGLVLAAWQQPVARLLIFDNLEDPQALKEWRPASGGCRVLVTARRQNWPPAMARRVFDLPALERADSLRLLAYGDEARERAFAADEAASQIADRLGDLPLALHVAGAYLAHYGMTPAAYLAELDAQPVLKHESLGDWLADELPTEHIPNVAATFELSYHSLISKLPETGDSRLEIGVFHLMAHCAPAAPVPREVLMEAADIEDGKRLTDALRRLSDVGLITLDAELRPIAHRLIQEYARSKAADPDVGTARMEQAVGDMAEEINERGLPQAMTPVLPHLRALAERAEIRGSQNAGWLFNETGYHLKQIADYASARTALERALAIDEKAFGPDHPKVAIRVNNLGSVYRDLGDLPAARAALERALAIDEKAFGPDHPNVATDVNNLGEVYEAEGDSIAAREAYQRALAIMEKYAPDNPNTRIFRENLARVMREA